MKKSLIALAAVAASGAALAQSSVTLYGLADVGLTKITGQSLMATTSNIANVNNAPSRIGFRGVEDLGGGLKATFTMEQFVSLADGSTAPNTFARQAWLGLEGGFGAVRAGRQLTPSFDAAASWELTGLANYSAVANRFGFGGTGPRNDALLKYTTPDMGGFKASVGYILKPNNANNAKTDLALMYGNGPLAVGFSYNKVSGSKANTALGAAYDFGGFKLGGSIQDPAGVSKGFSLGGSVPLGAFSLALDVARDTGIKATSTVFEAKYALSKRTFVYGDVLRDGLTKTTYTGIGMQHRF